MDSKRRVNVSELVEGLSVEEVYLVKDASFRETRTGKSYIAAQLADSTGTITTRVWDAQPAHASTFKTGRFLRVRGHVESYQGSPQLVVGSFKPVESSELDLAAFMPATDKDPVELENKLRELIESVSDKPLRAVLDAFFGDEKFMDRFRRSPAASSFHHACVGGLLEHTVGVAGTAAHVAGDNPELDRDLLVAGALLHDLGKVYELSAGPTFEYTDAGKLLGHILMGVVEAEKRMAALEDFPAETRLLLLHLLASHHGQREFGSPVLPATAEALALHHIDNLDAKIRAAADARPASPEDQDWSEFQRMLGVRIYRKKREG